MFSWDDAKNRAISANMASALKLLCSSSKIPCISPGKSVLKTTRIAGRPLAWSAVSPCFWLPIPGMKQRAVPNIFESSRRGEQQSWKGQSMNKVPESIRKELAALAAAPENDIDFSDLPATTRQDWQDAVRGKFYRPVKQQLTVRIDADIVEWLKSQGKGYQSRLNDILRAAMLDKVRRR